MSRDHFDIALDVLADMYNAPLFEPDEIERERGVILEELAMTYDHPDSLADLLIDHALWPDQPMGRDVGGTRESVGGITKEQLAAYHARQYVPSNTVVAVAGNVEHEEVVERVAAALGYERAQETLPMRPVLPDEDSGVRVEVAHRKTDQAHICLAVDGPAANADDRYAVDMMNTVLGEGMSSRLFVELRERRGLAYDVHSSAMHYHDCGALLVSCGVDTANADKRCRPSSASSTGCRRVSRRRSCRAPPSTRLDGWACGWRTRARSWGGWAARSCCGTRCGRLSRSSTTSAASRRTR